MSADPIIYCLERLTDYRQFERLCSDVMAGSGYPDIEPIGGTGDRGRDALHGRPDGLTLFAYTVRSDWRRKLEQDCERIREEKHSPERLVFVCTSTLNGHEKDEARNFVRSAFRWTLEPYDLERLRVLLAGNLRHLVAQHPAIFCPPWFPQKGGLSTALSADTFVIDHLPSDHALATWLDRRLSLAGYPTWCFGTAPIAAEDADATVRELIDKRALLYLPVLSAKSLADRDFVDRCGAAGARDALVFPCWAESVADVLQHSRLSRLAPARFHENWSTGLRDVLQGLQSRGMQPRYTAELGRGIALRAYIPEPVTKAAPERVFANVFRASLPKSILVYELSEPLSEEATQALRRHWAFVVADSQKLLSFHDCPGRTSQDSRVAPARVRMGRLRDFRGQAHRQRREGAPATQP